MPDPCLAPTPRISLDLTGSPGALEADIIPSADPYNGVELRGDGLWVPGRPPVVTGSLPGAPVDGDEIYYLADPTNGILWHLIYVAAEVTAYKWYVVGQVPMAVKSSGSVSFSPSGGFTWQTIGGAGPSIVLPLGGYYNVQYGSHIDAPNDGTATQIGISISPSDPGINDVASNYNTRIASVSGFTRMLGPLIAGDTLRMMYRTDLNVGTANWSKRWIILTPVKLG